MGKLKVDLMCACGKVGDTVGVGDFLQCKDCGTFKVTTILQEK